MSFAQKVATSRRDFIKLMSSLGLVVLTGSGCARVSPVGERPSRDVRLRDPQRTGRLHESQLEQIWQIFDHIGQVWENRDFCTIQSLDQLEPIITLKTTRVPSYLTEYRAALTIFQQLREDLDPQRALHRLYFESGDEHLRRYVIEEFLRLQIAHGGFRFLPYQNATGYAGGSFDDDGHLPYRSLGDSCGVPKD